MSMKRKSKWRIMKRKGVWYAYKRHIDDGPMPYVIANSSNRFDTWAEALDWVRHDRRKSHA
jgi:hypothetical protein